MAVGIPCLLPYEGYVLYKTPPMKDGRKRVHLYNSTTNHRCWLQVAKYKLEVFLGRKLRENEQADHIDEDPTNDKYSNLQVLTNLDNVRKHVKLSGKTEKHIKRKCPLCKKSFARPSHEIKYKILQGKEPCCSRGCGAKWGHQIRNT